MAKTPEESFLSLLITYEIQNASLAHHALTRLPFLKSTKSVHTSEHLHRQIQLLRMLFNTIFTQLIPTYPSEFNFNITL